MSRFRRDSMVGKLLVLSLALSMLGAGGLLHLTHHLPGDEESEAPWECSQCKIAENSIGEFTDFSASVGPVTARTFSVAWAEFAAPGGDRFEPTSPRAPPVLT